MIDPQLENKVVLITGANHGIGAATARAFAAQRARVCLAYYRGPTGYSGEELRQAREAGVGGDALYRAMQQQLAEPLVQMIRESGCEALAHECDLAELRNIPRLFDMCEAALGPVDILINNHTHCVLETFDPALTTTDQGRVRLLSAAEIDAHFTINARAYALLMVEYVRRYLARQARSGRIVNISTDAAHAHV